MLSGVATALERVNIGPGPVEADAWSFGPSVSTGGQFVAFASMASNLVDGDTNLSMDVFVYDRLGGQTTRVMGDGDVEPNGYSESAHQRQRALRCLGLGRHQPGGG